MKTDFLLGFCVGLVVKEFYLFCKLVYPSKVKTRSQDKKFVLIAKITNNELFEEYFPELGTKYKTQPQWEYNPSKGIIKINLEQELVDGLCDDYLETTDIDISFFKIFSKLYVYVSYFCDNIEYINVYQPSDTINNSDFTVMETQLSTKYQSLMCAQFIYQEKPVYITKYFKMFLNNKTTVTPEILLMYNDQIKQNSQLVLLNNGEIIHNLI